MAKRNERKRLIEHTRASVSRRSFLVKAGGLAISAASFPNRLIAGCTPTSSDALGPFYAENAPVRTVLCSADEPGTRLFISGRVFGSDCATPVEGAIVDVWHATDAGCYSVFETCPDEDPFNCRGQMLTNADGEYAYETILPGYYATRPLHVHYLVAPPEGKSLTTQLYFEFDPRAAGQPDDIVIPLETVDGQLEGVFDVSLDYDVPADTDPDHSLPTAIKLHQSYPNPFRPTQGQATIRYQLRLEANTVLEVFTPNGARVRRLVQKNQPPGFYTTRWDGRDEHGRNVAAGVYLYRLRAGSTTEVQKLTLIR